MPSPEKNSPPWNTAWPDAFSDGRYCDDFGNGLTSVRASTVRAPPLLTTSEAARDVGGRQLYVGGGRLDMHCHTKFNCHLLALESLLER